MQHIEVKNFGPLKDISLDIKDYMVFIGPQASGKSTLAKLIYFFWKVEDKYRREVIPTYLLNKALPTPDNNVNYVENFKKDIRKLFSDIFPTYRRGEVTFTYSNEYRIHFNVDSYNLKAIDDITIGKGFLSEFEIIDQRIKDSSALTRLLSEKKFALNELLEIFSNEFLSNNDSSNKLKRVFIPAGRSILSLFASSLTFIDSNSLDYFNADFVKFTNTIRKFLESSDYANNFGWMARIDFSGSEHDVYYLANNLSLEILKGDFQMDNKGDGIMHYYNGSGYLVPLKHTSSGQQESTWLLNVIQYLLFESEENRFDVIIEEPEANLFPDTQRAIAKLITLLSQTKSNNNRIIVTTHSPYVLATLNNSIKAFSVAQTGNKSSEVKAILPEEFWINPENLFVGFMNKNEGEDNFNIQDIYDPELGLINHEVLDKVSDDIIKQFDELLDIQYSE